MDFPNMFVPFLTVFAVAVCGLLFRRAADAVASAVISLARALVRGVYWMLIGWWVARIRRRIIGSYW